MLVVPRRESSAIKLSTPGLSQTGELPPESPCLMSTRPMEFARLLFMLKNLGWGFNWALLSGGKKKVKRA